MKTRYFYLIAVLLIIAFVAAWLGLLEHIAKPPQSVHAQGGICTQTIAVNVAAANSQTILTGSGSDVIYVCGMVLSADTIATTGQFKSNTTAITGAMRFQDEGNIVAGNFQNSILFQTAGGESLVLTAATGAITGFIMVGQN